MTENPKIHQRSVECILVEYSENSKAYRCWHQSRSRVHISRNVTLAESQDLTECSLHPSVILGKGLSELPMGDGPTAEAEHERQPEEHRNVHHMVEEKQLTINPDAELRRSTRATRPSAAGVVSKGIPPVSEMDRVQTEI
jgi:hypothetical protein